MLGDCQTIDLLPIAVLGWLAIGLAGLFLQRLPKLITRGLIPLGATISVAVAGLALISMTGAEQTRHLPLGLPDLPFHLRLDALSAFFLFLLGAASAGISIYTAG